MYVCTVLLLLPPQAAAEPTADPCQRLPNDDLVESTNEKALGSLPIRWDVDIGQNWS